MAKLQAKQPIPFRRMEVESSDEAQIDFGTGVPVITPKATDAAFEESTWSETDHTTIAKDLTFVSTKKSTAASDELFALGLNPYVDFQ